MATRRKPTLDATEAQIMEAEIDVALGELSKVYEGLPDDKKAVAIRLANGLSVFRKKLERWK